MVLITPAGFESVSSDSFPSPGASGRSQVRPEGATYPSPFLDIASTYMPSNIKGLIRICQMYATTNPIVSAAVEKKSEFPITDFIYSTENMDEKNQWSSILEEEINLKSELLQIGKNYWSMGNVFLSVYLPEQRFLVCPKCNNKHTIEEAKYKFKNYRYHYKCKNPECSFDGIMDPLDIPIKKRGGISIKYWDPLHIDIDYDPIRGIRIYKYNIPSNIKKAVLSGEPKYLLDYLPTYFIDAIKEQRQVIFKQDQLFHFRRPSLAGQNIAWGTPPIVSALKYLYIAQIFLKSREVIAHQFVIPLWVVFPQAGNGQLNPFTHINLEDWVARVQQEITKWRQDPAYIPVMPLPLGFQHIGGQGLQMSIVPELEQIMDDVMAGLLTPREFVKGGLTYSGTSLTMRLLEVHFSMYRGLILQFINSFIIPKIAQRLELPKIKLKFSDLRMADDIQRKQIMINLASQNKLSFETLFTEMGISLKEELKKIKGESQVFAEMQIDAGKDAAKVQGEQQLVMASYAIKIQLTQQQLMSQAAKDLISEGKDPIQVRQAMTNILNQGGIQLPMNLMKNLYGEAQNEVQNGQINPQIENGASQTVWPVDFNKTMDAWAQQIASIPDPMMRNQLLEQLKTSLGMETYYDIMNRLQNVQSVDMRPLPEQKPPRRSPGIV